MANTSDYEGDEDIIAHYEDQESDGDRNSLNEAATSDNDKDDETGTKRRIDPSTSKTHVIRRNPIPKLNTERLKGPNGVHTIENYFDGFKFYGKGNEKTDLDRILKRLEHWSHRLFPKYHFDDFLARVEQLGSKKDLQVYIKKYRLDMITADHDAIVHDNTDNEEEDQQESAPLDDLDLLITEQIQKQKQAKTQSATAAEDAFNELLMQTGNISNSQVPSTSATGNELNNEVKERIERNKQLAIQRRLQRQAEQEGEMKRRQLAESANGEPPSENSNLTVNDEIDTSQVDGIQSQTNGNMNEITCADKSEEVDLE